MTKDEALKLALEALKHFEKAGLATLKTIDAIIAVRECLEQQNKFNPDWDAMAVMVEEQQRMAKRIAELEAQQEQEPVAWITKNGKGWLRWHRPEDNEKNKDSIPLYTTPPHRKPLMDEEIDKLPWEPHEGNPMTFAEGLRYFARAIEAAHGIKE